MIGFLLVKVVIGNDDLKMQIQFHKRVCQEHKNKKEMLVGLDESNVCTNGLHRHFFTKWYFLKTFIRKSIMKINNVPLYRIFPLNIAVHSCLTFIPYACHVIKYIWFDLFLESTIHRRKTVLRHRKTIIWTFCIFFLVIDTLNFRV